MIPRHTRGAVHGFALGALALTGLIGALWLPACGATNKSDTLLPAAAPPAIQEACQLTTERCSHCHPIERLTVARGIGMHRWEIFVEEMRRKPSSGISVADAEVVMRCLRHFEETPAP